MELKKLSNALVLIAAAAGNAGLAQAQEVVTSEDIVITATRRSTNLQDTPLSVSALSGEQLEQRGLQSVGTAVQLVPGVALTNSEPGTNDIIIRGVGTAVTSSSNADVLQNALTSTYLNQVPVTSTVQKTPDFRFVDLDRVEVLRGPQGTLYGQSAMGGVVRYIPNAPTTAAFSGGFDTSASFTESGGLNRGGDGHLNVPLGDTLALRVVGYAYGNEGFIDVIGTSQDENANTEETLGGRAALRWTPTERLTVDLSGLYSETNLGSRQLVSATYPVDYNFLTPPVITLVSTDRLEVQHRQPSDESASVLSADVLYDFGPFTANLIVAHKETESESTFESAELVGVSDVYFGNQTLADTESDTVELRFASSGEGNFLDWIFGAYLEDTSGVIASRGVSAGDPLLLFLFRSFPGDVVIDSGRQLDYEELSLFGEATLNFTPDLAVTVGYRNADVENDYQWVFANGSLEPAGRPALVGVPQGTSETVDTYKLNVSYDLTDDFLLYANAASGYRPGGFNPGTTLPVLIPDSEFQSDSLWNYEIGFRSSWMDGRLTLNGAVYQIDWSDIQLSTIDLVTFYASVKNLGEAEITGAELEASWIATDNLTLSGSYTYTSAELTEDVPSAFVSAGDQLPGTPENSGNVVVDWHGALGNGAEWQANAIYRYVGDRVAVLGSPTIMPSYSTLDLRTSIAFEGGVTLGLFAENVTDEIAVNQVSAGLLGGFSYYTINRPRTIGVTAGYRF